MKGRSLFSVVNTRCWNQQAEQGCWSHLCSSSPVNKQSWRKQQEWFKHHYAGRGIWQLKSVQRRVLAAVGPGLPPSTKQGRWHVHHFCVIKLLYLYYDWQKILEVESDMLGVLCRGRVRELALEEQKLKYVRQERQKINGWEELAEKHQWLYFCICLLSFHTLSLLEYGPMFC